MSMGSESRLCHIFLLTRATHPSLMSLAAGPCSKKIIMLPGGLLKGILGVAFLLFTPQLQFLDTYVCLLQMKFHRNASDSQSIPCRTVAIFLGHCFQPVCLQKAVPAAQNVAAPPGHGVLVLDHSQPLLLRIDFLTRYCICGYMYPWMEILKALAWWHRLSG